MKDLIRRLIRHSPWETIEGWERCFFCGHYRNERLPDAFREHHEADCPYIEAVNEYGEDENA